ncbi:hypothetical protein KDW_10910 [Dictyobacter vulcani]|uniref:Protein-export membrane protein SecF n=1 Tax=Dictyobacter vulcani TaxID=2607529 RepID=A0A5J4KL77_9CHLR|nr:protein translocase subunit SecF [Dictyobacter vulcani]GER86929.1 hypothetical protein KDW_10910 [Dictyobacter vulcani]
MLNLVKYRKLFLLISLIVIIPGTISLIIFGLNVGIDFAGGSNVVLRPQRPFTDTDTVRKLLTPLHLDGDTVVLGTDAKSGSNTAWIRLDSQIDSAGIQKFEDALSKKYNQQPLHFDVSTIPDKKPYTLLVASQLKDLPTSSDVKSTLSSVSTNSDASKSAKVQDVQVGNSSQTVNILTKTSIIRAAGSDSNKVDLNQVQNAFLQNGGPYFLVQSSSQVGASVAGRTIEMSILAVIAASFLILLYVWFSFRKIPRALRYGVCAIVALLHDVLVVLGIFSILGKFFNMQIDSLFITALLTVIGFSVHDTIVVFDRVRENMQRQTVETFEEVVNASLIQTLARSLNTSLTVLFTLLTLTLFTGIGTDIHTFTLTLLIGIFSGTYSSIFNASMMLVIWEKGELGFKYLQRNRDEKQFSSKRDREVREFAQTRG